MTTLYIIRHGETTGNDAGRFQGSTDCGLSERGYAQVERLGERCRDLPFEVLISSPLVRARETASAANRHHGLPMRIDADLAEMHCGDWEGKELGRAAGRVSRRDGAVAGKAVAFPLARGREHAAGL